VHQGHADEIGQPRPDIAGVGIVAVDEVGPLALFVQKGGQVVDEGVEMVPELFLGQIALGTGVEAQEARFLAERFDGFGIVGADGGSTTRRVTRSTRETSARSPSARARSTTYLVCPPVSASRPSSRS
jgi:hypothetical protein